MREMTVDEAIKYLTPIAESARLPNYAAALTMAISALRAQQETENTGTEAVPGMCCDCVLDGPCCDYSENPDCPYHKEDGSCWTAFYELQVAVENESDKPLFNADAAEEYFSNLCVNYRDIRNDIFKRDNDGRHASEQIYSPEYQKFLGMEAAMREVLEYFSKFDLGPPDSNEPLTLEELRKMGSRYGLQNMVKNQCGRWFIAIQEYNEL